MSVSSSSLPASLRQIQVRHRCCLHRSSCWSSKQSACYTQCIRVCVQMSAQLLPLAPLTAASCGAPAVSSVCDRCKHGIRAIDLVHCTGLVCHSMQSAQFTAARLGVPANSGSLARSANVTSPFRHGKGSTTLSIRFPVWLSSAEPTLSSLAMRGTCYRASVSVRQ